MIPKRPEMSGKIYRRRIIGLKHSAECLTWQEKCDILYLLSSEDEIRILFWERK